MKGDYHAIAKYDGKWYYVNLVWGPLESGFCFDDYCMDDVSFEKNIYCKPQSEGMEITDKFIILKQKRNGKFGVLLLNIGKAVIPFEYDDISFIKGDKSKVKVYNASTGESKILPLG